jgi:putative PIN family toxin of toxin-antitoxin system
MLRLVIDTNTLVSGFGWGGPPGSVVDAVLDGRAVVLLSAPLREELARVLRYPKLARAFPDPDRILTLLTTIAVPVEPTQHVSVLADEPDNRVLEAAINGQADLIVTGDAALLDLETIGGIRTVTARQATRLIDQHHNSAVLRHGGSGRC